MEIHQLFILKNKKTGLYLSRLEFNQMDGYIEDLEWSTELRRCKFYDTASYAQFSADFLNRCQNLFRACDMAVITVTLTF